MHANFVIKNNKAIVQIAVGLYCYFPGGTAAFSYYQGLADLGFIPLYEMIHGTCMRIAETVHGYKKNCMGMCGK